MKKKYDFSLHFTTKGQELKELVALFDKWLIANSGTIDCSEREIGEQRTVFHHCFLHKEDVVKKGFNTDIVDYLDTVSEDIVRWYSADTTIGMSRFLMLQNLLRIKGVAVFLGQITGGVKDEYDLAKQLGVEIIYITQRSVLD